MNIFKSLMILTIAAAMSGCCNGDTGIAFEKCGEMPDIEQGYGQGVSACYAAATADALFIAGGCNFPGTPAAEGGAKVYYNGIYTTSTDGTFTWEKAGELPMASAYGANIQNGNTWYIIGGMNSDGATGRAFSIDIAALTDGRAAEAIKELPALPCTIDNLSGTIAGNTLYIVGGNADGKASNRAFSFEPGKDSTWNELPAMPDAPRVQPVCAHARGNIYVWGGFAPAADGNDAAVHCDGIRYDIAAGRWEATGEIKGERGTITLSGGSAVTTDSSTIIAAGGVDKDIFLDAISGRYDLVRKEDYMYKPASWYRFNNELLRFDATSGAWSTIATDSTFARAGAQIVNGGNALYQIGGELKPGIRTPGIYRIKSN